MREISEHNHYIQGVAWDPLTEYIATQSSDRSVHVHQLYSKSASEYASVQTVGRNTRMDVHHRRGGSTNAGHFVWDPNAKPPMKRRASSHASHASHASDSEREGPPPSNKYGETFASRTGRSRTPLDITAASALAGSSTSATGPISAATPNSASASSAGGHQRASTPTLSHQSPALTSMNPPQRTPSRRSSFSGSQIEALSPPTSATSLAPYSHPASVAATGGNSTPVKTSTLADSGQTMTSTMSNNSRSASRTRGPTPRSPSPAPPLPAIRAPPSPKQRMAAAAAIQSQSNITGVGTLAKAGMRLYGDENFSGFFRRLTFSPDGALLVTPTGIFENTNTAVLNQMQSPASPTVATHSGRRLSDCDDHRASPSSPSFAHHHLHSPAVAAATAPPPTNNHAAPRSTVYLYGRGNLHKSNAPIAHLPGHKTASLVIKFSPILYELRKGARWNRADETDGIPPHPNVPLEVGKQKTVSLVANPGSVGSLVASSVDVQDDFAIGSEGGYRPKTTRSYSSTSSSNSSPNKQTSATPPASTTSMIGLPYRMIFAVATHDSVWIYDTQQVGPLCCFSNLHYASFTDLTWSSDGQTLMMCSTDGYCSVVVFDYGELGTPYHYHSQPSLQQTAAAATSTFVSTTANKSASVGETPLMARRGSGQGQSLSSQEGIKSTNQSARAATPPLSLGLATEAGDAQAIDLDANTNDSTQGGAKKKRRIAPTLQGPIGS